MKIIENKYFSNIHGMEILDVIVGDFETSIAQWKDDKKYYLTLKTTPKTLMFDTNKPFKFFEDAKIYYLKTLKIVLEDNLEILKDIDYTTYNKKVKE